MSHVLAGSSTLSVRSKELMFYGNASLNASNPELCYWRIFVRMCPSVCTCFMVDRKDNGCNEVRADGLTVTGHTWFNRYWLCNPCCVLLVLEREEGKRSCFCQGLWNIFHFLCHVMCDHCQKYVCIILTIPIHSFKHLCRNKRKLCCHTSVIVISTIFY